MGKTVFNESDIKRKVPKKVIERVRESMETYNMSLGDAFKEAACKFSKPGTRLFAAWYYDDFREYIPSEYQEKYLDFEKYPLKYETKEENQ